VDDDTIRWLASRQISTEDEEKGGFNGRVNKPADTCYSFWVGGALDILGVKEFVSSDMNRQYLLTYTQHAQLGGFGKEEGVYPGRPFRELMLNYRSITHLPRPGESYSQ